MDNYEKLLDEAYKKVKVVTGSSGRFEIPKVKGRVEGKNTIITNVKIIADYLRRPVEQLAKYLLRELAVSGKIEKTRLIINRKINSAKVNEKIEQYTKDYVICEECSKPDTEIVSEKGVKLKHCLACGAKHPIKGRT